ncbi:MAG: PDZ domain-containing protein [Candidatus Pacearchaeota archaeon]
MKLTWRIWLLLFLLLMSILSIFSFPPTFLNRGAVIKSIDPNSSAFQAGLRQGDIIVEINNRPVNSAKDYYSIVSSLNLANNSSTKILIKTTKSTISFFNEGLLSIIVSDIQKTNLKTGLDLQGGARALISAKDVELSDSQLKDLIAISNERFNVYGISDVSIKPVKDLSGKNYMLIEIAGATPKDLDELISKQGKFEAKIGNEIVFVGGNDDITYVCRDDARCAGIESCNQFEGGYVCRYRFVIHLSEEAAKRHARITENLSINASSIDGRYLEKQIDFYVDDILTTSLFISEDLKGKVATQIQIQGSGSGPDAKAAFQNAQDSMKKMQTILITGSLPYKLEIIKLDTISPTLGNRFNYLLLLTGFLGIIVVSTIIFVRYRSIKSSLALLFTSFSEVVLILGVASLIKWNLDLPSIVGILVTIGTGVDQQIVLLDESKSKRADSIRAKIKDALFIIISAFFTTAVSLLPLIWAGAGLLKGFAVTTLIGITIGVLISRPAFADFLRIIEENK